MEEIIEVLAREEFTPPDCPYCGEAITGCSVNGLHLSCAEELDAECGNIYLLEE